MIKYWLKSKRKIFSCQMKKSNLMMFIKWLEKTNIPANNGRKNVLPEGVTEVMSITLGAITTRQNNELRISNCTEARTELTKVLCRMMHEHEPDFKFTSITLNKNYSGEKTPG